MKTHKRPELSAEDQELLTGVKVRLIVPDMSGAAIKNKKTSAKIFLTTDEHGLALIMTQKSLKHNDPRKDNIVLSFDHPVKTGW
jgi:hypothetical protein